MPAKQNKLVFTYHTRLAVTPDQDRALSDYAPLFGRVERTLYADLQKGKNSDLLKSDYLVRFGLTARQFNAVGRQLEGKINATRELFPLTDQGLKDENQEGEEEHRPAGETTTWFKATSSQEEAAGRSRVAARATTSGRESRPHPPLLWFQQVVPRSVLSPSQWISIARRMEAGVERGAVKAVLCAGLKGRDRRLSGLRVDVSTKR